MYLGAAYSILGDMKNDYARAFAKEVAREINAEASRRGVRTARAFTRFVGSTNHTSWNKKLSPDLAEFTVMSVVDLAKAARALHIEPAEIMRRAQVAADWSAISDPETVLAEKVAAELDRMRGPEESAHTTGTA